MFPRPPIRRLSEGEYKLSLGRRERAVLRTLPDALERLLEEEPDSSDLRRLFPPAYAEDEGAEDEYRRLMREELLEGRRAALRAFADSLERDRLTAEELDAWLRALNDLRLFLGTRLDVSEEQLAAAIDPRDPRAEEMALYVYLSWLQEHVVEALSAD